MGRCSRRHRAAPVFTWRSIFILAFVIGLSAEGASSAQQIEMRKGEPVLVLPPEIARALERFDSGFRPRRLRDYPPYMWRRPCRPMPSCALYLYKLNTRQAPFAVVGDFNGDRVLDVVIDGDNRTTGRRIVLLSGRDGFRVSELNPLSRIGGDEGGVQEGLSRVQPGKYESGYETAPLILRTDAFQAVYYEKASSIQYYRNRRWHSYTTSD